MTGELLSKNYTALVATTSMKMNLDKAATQVNIVLQPPKSFSIKASFVVTTVSVPWVAPRGMRQR